MRNLNKKTVYPAQWVYGVLGQSSPELNQALTVWAGLLQDSMVCLEEGKFSPEEWEYLAHALKGKQMPTTALPTFMRLLALVESAGPVPPGLDLKLRHMPEMQSWAVWRLCRWHDQHRRHLNLDGQPWWRLAWRQEHTLEGKDGD